MPKVVSHSVGDKLKKHECLMGEQTFGNRRAIFLWDSLHELIDLTCLSSFPGSHSGLKHKAEFPD